MKYTIEEHVELASGLERLLELKRQGYSMEYIRERILPPSIYHCQVCRRVLKYAAYTDEAICTQCGGPTPGYLD